MEENKYYYCHVVGTTDVGCVRKANEDSMGSRETVNGLVSVVCDGMGGHVGGATASRLAVDTILDFLDQMHFDDPREAIGRAIDAANMAVLQRVQMQPELRGMGTTCVVVLVRDGQVYYGHVGDSRIYLVRKHIIKQLTKDQSYVQMLVDMGQITPEEAEHHERKNEITNAIGVEGMQHATVCDTPINPEAGDCFLLCSDGLSGMVSNHEIEKIVSNQVRMRAQERTDTLVEKAKQYGGLDNVTAQIVEFSVTPTPKGATIDKKKLAVFGGIGIAVIAVILLLIFKPWKQEVEIHTHDKIYVDFKKGTVFSKITFDDDFTTVKIGDNKEPIRIQGTCTAVKIGDTENPVNRTTELSTQINGLSIKKGNDDNFMTLSFGDKPVKEVKFSLKAGLEEHLFTVEVNSTGDTENTENTENTGDTENPVTTEEIFETTVGFKKNTVFSEITFADESTTVKIGDLYTKISGRVKLDSWSPEDKVISKFENDNVITLSFGDDFVDTVKFCLKTTILSREYRFKVAVKGGKTESGTPATNQKLGSKKSNGHYEYEIPVEIDFKSEGDVCIIQFVIKDNKNKINIFDVEKNRVVTEYEGNDGQGFKMDGKGNDIISVDGCVVNYEKDEPFGKYVVRFKKDLPEGDAITFKAYDCSGNECQFYVKIKKQVNGDPINFTNPSQGVILQQ